MTSKKNYKNRKFELLTKFTDFLEAKAKENPEDESHIFADDTVPKNCILFTDNETGEQLKLKVKITDDKLEIVKVIIPRKKK